MTFLASIFLAAAALTAGPMPIEDNFQYERLTVSDGLANMITRATAQTSNGLIWFATYGGVQSYDGSVFRTYHVSMMEGEHGDDDRFISIISLGDTLWCSTFTDVFVYDPVRDSFSCIFSPETVNHALTVNSLNIVAGKYLFISANTGIYVYDTSGSFLKKLTVGECMGVTQVFDTVYAATSGGVRKILTGGGSIEDTGDEALCPGERISFIKSDGIGNLWFQPRGGDLLCYAPYSGFRNTDSINAIISGKIVRDLIIYDGCYFIAIDGLGILYSDLDLDTPRLNTGDGGGIYSPAAESVYNLFRDSNGYLWLSTFTGGVNYVNPRSSGFLHLNLNRGLNAGERGQNIRAIFSDSRGRIWLGHKSGVCVYDLEKDGRQTAADIELNTVLAINEDIRGNIWASAFSDGIYVYDGDMKPAGHLNRRDSGIGSDEIFVIFRDSGGNMWLSGENGTLTRVDVADGMSADIYYTGNVARSIIELDSGDLAIGGSDGVGIFDRTSGTYRKLRSGNAGDFYPSMVYSILETDGKTLALGTEGKGLVFIDLEGNTVNRVTTDNGLISNTIYGVEQDASGNLWCSSSSGLSVYNLETGKITNFSTESGLRVNGYMYCSHTALQDGRIVFGGIGGATVVFPDRIDYYENKNSIYFDHLLISGRKVIAGPKSPISSRIDRCRSVDLKYGQNSFTVSFRSIQPAGTFPDLYDWKLEGYSRDWTYSTSARTIDFVKLPPGKYVLKIRSALTPDTVHRELPITVHRPWYTSWWIFPFYLALAACVFVLVWKYLDNLLKTRLFENKVKVFATLAHDIKNPLSVIRLTMSKMQNDEAVAGNEGLKQEVGLVVGHSDKITGIINRLLEIETATDVDVAMRVAKYRLEASLQGFMSAYESIIEEKGLHVSYDFPDTPTWVWFDMDCLQRVFQNLMDNAVKYTPAGGSILISTERLEKECVIAVKDTGIGIPAAEKSKVFKGYFRASNVSGTVEGSGVGLMSVRQIVKKMHGSVRFVSAENEGSTFYVYLPLGNSHVSEADMIRPVYLPAASATGKDIRIVVAEDNLELQNIIVEHLGGFYSVSAAGDGRAALDLVRQVSPQMVITDYMMPEMTGIDLIKAIRADKALHHIPVIMLTALTSSKSKVTGYRAGADAIIEKPFDMDVLFSRIENILNHGTYPQGAAPEEEDELLALFTSNVRDRLSDSEFSVENICRQIGVSYPTLYRKIKASTGKSPIDIVTEMRLAQADEYLSSGKYSVSQVCYMTGFSSPSYFTKVYRKHFGITPTARYTRFA